MVESASCFDRSKIFLVVVELIFLSEVLVSYVMSLSRWQLLEDRKRSAQRVEVDEVVSRQMMKRMLMIVQKHN